MRGLCRSGVASSTSKTSKPSRELPGALKRTFRNYSALPEIPHGRSRVPTLHRACLCACPHPDRCESVAWQTLPQPFFLPYSPNLVEGEFCEVGLSTPGSLLTLLPRLSSGPR